MRASEADRMRPFHSISGGGSDFRLERPVEADQTSNGVKKRLKIPNSLS